MAHTEVNFDRDVYCVMGLPIDAIDMAGAVQRVRDAAFNNKRCFISTPNLNFVMAAREDAAFRDSVLRSDLCLADGMPLVWVSRLLGLPIRERVSGAGLFENLLNHPGPPVKVYFFGGPEGAAEAACRRVNERGRGLRCVGFDAPGFGSVEQMSSDGHIDRINQSGAQFVIVALGAKKGQAWIERNLGRLRPPVVCHLGAVVNFAAGTVRRAPRWIQLVGAEWLWRIKEEPSLWRRYRSDGASLAWEIVRHVLPMALSLRVSASSEELIAPDVSVAKAGQVANPELVGLFNSAQGDRFRHSLKLVCSDDTETEVVCDVTAMTNIDSACIGLLLLAHGSLVRPRRMVLRGARQGVARTLRRSGAAFLLE